MDRLLSHNSASCSSPFLSSSYHTAQHRLQQQQRLHQQQQQPIKRREAACRKCFVAATLAPALQETISTSQEGLDRRSSATGLSKRRPATRTAKERTARGASSLQAPYPLPGPTLQPLDMAYMQKVYQESWLYQSGTNPEWVQLNKHILSRLKRYSSIEQVQKLVDIELPSMSGITVAQVMLKAAIQLRPKTSEGRYCSLRQLTQGSQAQSLATNPSFSLHGHVATAAAAVDDDGAEPIESSSQNAILSPKRSRAAANAEHQHRLVREGHASSWLQVAPALVRRLLVHLVHLPANQVTMPSVVMAIQSLGVVTEGRMPLSSAEQSAVAALLQHVRVDLFLAGPEQLAQLAHGLCFAQVSLPDSWLKEYSKVVLSKLALMNTYQLGFVSHALGRQGYVPDEFWLSYFASITAPKLASMRPRELSNTLWAVAQWHVDLGAEWREAACSAVMANLHTLPTACFASILRSLQTICHSLPLTWLAMVVARLVELAPHMTLKQDCEVLAAFASLTYMPEQSNMAAYVECMQPKLAAASPSELAIALKALARLHFLPTRAWLNDWVAAARRQVRGFQAEETANALACFATWKVKPPRDFTQDLFELTVAQARQGAFPPYFATRMLCALATLRLAPPRQVLRQLLQVLGSESLVVQNEQVGVKHSGKVGSVTKPETAADPRVGGSFDLDHRLMAAALANAFAALPCLLRCYDPQQLASLAASASGSVAVVQGDDIMDSSSNNGNAGSQGSGALSSGPASGVAAGAVQGDRESSGAPAESNRGGSTAADAAGMSSNTNSTSSSNESKNLAGATIMLLPPSVVGPVLGVLSRRLYLLQGRHLCSVLLALVQLKLYPGRGFLMSHVSAVASQLPRMESSEKRRLSAYYAELNGQ